MTTIHPLLEVEDVRTEFATARGPVRAVDGVSLTLRPGETLGIVGESGSGKSVLGRTIMGLITNGPTTTVSGTVRIAGQDVHAISASQRRKLWGPKVAMVFQDPMTSLNPVKKVGVHITEALRLHLGLGKAEARERAIELLKKVGIPEPARRMAQYPHELSGGMRQRVVIAMALSCDPELLIADEPTTALDVTVQKQILDLLASLSTTMNMATILISHDLGAVEGRTDRVQVMYAGRVVETAHTSAVFAAPSHPYAEALLASIPRLQDAPHTLLRAINGTPPDMANPPSGCRFAPRCVYAADRCRTETPLLEDLGTVQEPHRVACHFPLAVPGRTPAATPADSAALDLGLVKEIN
ncbi:ABC transporter ATP-binding protein [Nocardioides ochotonae]|uniref:ABC transporter ATP-binding protein n=1 Tax=Nocardioides ochotonae TaxID=2685869 RepID=UPI00140B1CCD|nr:ABC transporter ATP-binding protein [Nocardioides ochotonae]